MKTIYILMVGISFSLVGCASKLNVIAIEDGQYELIERDQNERQSVDRARKNANRYCDKQKKIAQMVSEETTYEGQIEEEAAKVIQKAGAIAGILGVGEGEVGADIATSDSMYITKIKFMCK